MNDRDVPLPQPPAAPRPDPGLQQKAMGLIQAGHLLEAARRLPPEVQVVLCAAIALATLKVR